MKETIVPVEWKGDFVKLLDQTVLPEREEYLEVREIRQMWDAIQRLCVRGAPAIGVAAGYGVALEMQRHVSDSIENYHRILEEALDYLSTSRPTAVNLFWALGRMRGVGKQYETESNSVCQKYLEEEAKAIERYEENACIAIGENLLSLLEDGMTLLTHCNAGGIATVRYGTALSPMLLGQERGIHFKVYADETRPLLQGARLTAWELQKAGVDVTLITDNMAGMLMKQNKIDAVIVGCDRVAANGDAANKIGTYSVAVLAKHHQIPFYVAGPVSTIDRNAKTGEDIPIEERSPEEITCGFGKRTAPEGIKVYNPAFDVTPHELITAIVTEKGIVTHPNQEKITALYHNG
ncbi:MAG: S-methyl-5-thioribose-1-phosphate isomerase [Hespellia sp.]|nr:S-methyl-5-thioribose-1-phosphate isomerase [Hespellia sp.]